MTDRGPRAAQGSFRQAPAPERAGPRTITEDMRVDAGHSGKFLRLFGSIWMGVSAFVAVALGLTSVAAVGHPSGAQTRFMGLAMGGLFFLAGAAVYGIGELLRARTLAVFERGVEVQATVTKVFLDYRVRMNKKNPWRVVYRYRTEKGDRTGVATYWTDERPDAEEGDELTALYLPESPGRTILWSRLSVGGKAAKKTGVRLEEFADDAANASATPAATTVAGGLAEENSSAAAAQDAIAEAEAHAELEAVAAELIDRAEAAKIAEPRDDRDSDAKGSTNRSGV